MEGERERMRERDIIALKWTYYHNLCFVFISFFIFRKIFYMFEKPISKQNEKKSCVEKWFNNGIWHKKMILTSWIWYPVNAKIWKVYLSSIFDFE